MDIIDLFPIPITKVENCLSDVQRKKIFSFLKDINNTGNHGAFTKNAVSSHECGFKIIDIISQEIEGLENFKKDIQLYIDEFTNKTSYDNHVKNFRDLNRVNEGPLFLGSSWFNIQQKGSVLKQHIHSHCVVSGALFINVDADSSPLVFENPIKRILDLANHTENSSKYSRDWVTYKPSNGDLFLFPSWLEHGSYYQENMTPNRTVISFNAV